ncbi:MAG: hypothetical protein M1481_02115 [Candidatus Thermoplasmatota archaeon]|jgi:hypothetical protein|nr:hypothetical protein [Candidatus Thermoplasmatota archaeon]MCL5963596.1 hypothetical protein [Candidatus Thermoplasmatota archaeon]
MEDNAINNIMKTTETILHTEGLIGEVIHDMMKDEIKALIRKKLTDNPDIRDGIKNAMKEILEAKILESYAIVKLIKYSSDLGLTMVPSDMKKMLSKDMEAIIQKGIENMLIDK